MKRPLAASLAVAAILAAPSVAGAATAKHHKWHHAADYRTVRAAYGMYLPPASAPASSRFDPCANVNTITVESCNRLSVNGL
ncbi:MAG: hypothetical protein P4M07_00350 [Xanthobacteraceae bacterium]|nr:hypothetical protein [Xanthobacteraceae bacterium]